MTDISVGIIGAAGYSGLELIKLLKKHKGVILKHITSSKYEGQRVCDVFPNIPDVTLTFKDHTAELTDIDVVFLAVPNKASLDIVPELLEKGIKVIDLSGVYRIKNIDLFKKYYKLEHTSPEILEKAVFGLPEIYKEKIREADLIANPGCYPTAALLALIPLKEDLQKVSTDIIIDAKSGVSGRGGRSEDDMSNYCTCNENVIPYKFFEHQHQIEIEQILKENTPYDKRIIFTPHLVPLDRGILCTIYLNFADNINVEEIRLKYEKFYENEPQVIVLKQGIYAHIKMAVNTNNIFISVEGSENRLIITSVIDNLLKGASGQAVQNLNTLFDLENML